MLLAYQGAREASGVAFSAHWLALISPVKVATIRKGRPNGRAFLVTVM
jgi:hypothetical protein